MRRLIVTACLLLLVAATAHAQLVVNPTRVEFQVSADHGVALPDGTPAVSRYELRFYATGASQPQQTSNIGKPAPDGTGKATVDIASTIIAFPVSPTTQYTARVAALGPAGEGVSADSNPFCRVAAPASPANVTVVRP